VTMTHNDEDQTVACNRRRAIDGLWCVSERESREPISDVQCASERES